MNFRLVIFDVDGTLVPDMRSEVLTESAISFLKGLPSGTRIALASNQGGVGLRHWMETANFGNPDAYPTAGEAMARLSNIAGRITLLTQGPVLIKCCFAYESKRSGKWAPIPQGHEDDPFWSREWRKPHCGMLESAAREYGVTSMQTLFVGDRDEDEKAARKFGCHFRAAGASCREYQ